jgi:DNA-binding NarL/FixJ family response regulator
MTRRSVVVVDDHAMFRTGVKAELGAHPDAVEVLGEAADVDQAVEAVTRLRPEVVLLDVHLPGGGGAEVMRRVGLRQPETRFLALSVSDAAEDVIAVIRAGARGYVTKSIGPDELADAVRRVHEGDAVFSPRLAGFVLDAFAGEPMPTPATTGERDDPELDKLTARERDVLRLTGQGYSAPEIGRQLAISPKTVDTYKQRIHEKAHLSHRSDYVQFALKLGLLVQA